MTVKRYTNEAEPKLVYAKRKRDGLGRRIYFSADGKEMYTSSALLKFGKLSDDQQRNYLLAKLRHIRMLSERIDNAIEQWRFIGVDSWEVR